MGGHQVYLEQWYIKKAAFFSKSLLHNSGSAVCDSLHRVHHLRTLWRDRSKAYLLLHKGFRNEFPARINCYSLLQLCQFFTRCHWKRTQPDGAGLSTAASFGHEHPRIKAMIATIGNGTPTAQASTVQFTWAKREDDEVSVVFINVKKHWACQLFLGRNGWE